MLMRAMHTKTKKMARWVRQIRLLVWKNFILQIRRPIGTAFEIILPVAFASLLLVARFTTRSTVTDKCFSTFKSEAISTGSLYPPKVAFYPYNDWTNAIMNRTSASTGIVLISRSNITGNLFTSEDEVAKEVSNSPRNKYFGVIIFENANSKSMPKKISYKIRMSAYSYPPDTSRIYPRFPYAGPRFTSGYLWQFIPMQAALDKVIIEMQTAQSNLAGPDKLTQFPYPAYRKSSFMETVQGLMPPIFMIAFLYTAICIIRELVREKQERLKEAMKMMGLSNWVHWFSWFIKNVLFLAISCVILTITLKVGKVFEFTDGTLLFVFFLCYCFSFIFFCFAISVFCCNAICGMIVGAVLWILSYVPYAVISTGTNSIYDLMTVSQKAAACILPNTCLGIGVKILTQLESVQVGGQWKNISDHASIDDNSSLILVITMFLSQSMLWLIITWYVEAVFPGEFGVPKPFYFFVTPSYWCGSSWQRKNPCVEEIPMDTHEVSCGEKGDVEKPPHGSKVGVNIMNLKKVFKSSSGKKVAVDGLNLKIYKGQITALLGHNGAGKTTTMSILTGLYTPTSGSATVAGKSIETDMDDIRESLGLCPQHNVLFDRLSVKEHLEFFIALKGITGKVAEIKINQMLADLQLVDKTNAKSMTLSGGMKRKLCCAIALIGDPDVVFLDEPTSGMDAYARRATWDLLEKYTQNKTVVLTTHFMDEADYLGDRIAIMADGELRCCGSSLYLKKRYGVGYHMTLVKAAEFNEPAVTSLIESTIPSAKMVSNVGAEMGYTLEHESTQNFKDLFVALEQGKEKLGLSSFGVSITTLEEVFLKVGEGSIQAGTDGINTISAHQSNENVIIATCPESEKLSGMALIFSKFKAMFLKRFLNSKREKKAIITQILLPLVMIIGGLILTKVTSAERAYPPLVLDLAMFNKGSVNPVALTADYRDGPGHDKTKWQKYIQGILQQSGLSAPSIKAATERLKAQNMNQSIYFSRNHKGQQYYITATDKKACCKYPNLVLNKKCQGEVNTVIGYKSLCGSKDKGFGYSACITCLDDPYSLYSCPTSVQNTNLNDPVTFYEEHILEQSNAKRFFNKYVAGITLTNNSAGHTKINAWYSNQALHTVPSVVNAVNNIILAILTDGYEFSIKATAHPLPKSDKNKAQEAPSNPFNIIMLVFGTLTASFIAASFIVFIVNEKTSKAKHLQFVSGVNGPIYWLASFSWDFLNYLIPAICIMILFAAFQLPGFNAEDTVALCVVFLFYGLALLPFVYLVSFIFKSQIIAYGVTAILGMLISVAMTFGVFFCRMKGSTCETAAPIMHGIFLLIPTYGFSSSIMDVTQNVANRKLCSLQRSSRDCIDGFLKYHNSSMAFTFPGVGMTCLYFWIECFIYLGLVILIEERFFIKRRPVPPSSREDDPYEDVDVKEEKARIATMNHADIERSSVVVKDLTKVYSSNNLTAVNGVSIGIPGGECFGLLGVNVLLAKLDWSHVGIQQHLFYSCCYSLSSVFLDLPVAGAGKTTMFSMLTGELGITAGTAYLKGFNLQTNLREVQQRIGYCPQFDAILDRLTGREMLEMFARLRGIPSSRIPEIVNAVIYQLNLAPHADKMCGNYSGGNKRKLSTALALVGDPPVIFLDEPTSGMDPVSRRFLWNTLSSLLDDERSIILTSHSMEECEALCTRLVIMVNGELKCIGGLQHLKSRGNKQHLDDVRVPELINMLRNYYKKEGCSRFGQGYTLMIKTGKKEILERRKSIKRAGSVSSRSSTANRAFTKSITSDEDEPILENNELQDGGLFPKELGQPGEMQEIDNKVKVFIEKNFPGSYLIEERPGMLQYQIMDQSLPWSHMFGLLEDNAAQLDIVDYSLSQTTLEQVFINFAKYQRLDAPKKKQCCVCCCT